AIVHPRPVNINVVIRRAVTDLTLGLMNAAVILTAAYVATSALDLRLLSPVGLLTILAMAMAAALLAPGMRARLEWRVERLVFSRGVDRRRMLVEFTERTAGVLSLQELMVAVADLCARGIDSSYVVLLLPDERSGRFTPAHASGNLPRGLDACSIRVENAMLARLASVRGPVLAGSLLERPEARGMREEDRQELLPYRECLACLIPGRAGPAGILMAGPKVYGGAFSMEETELLSVAARQASVVLENARLFAEVQRQARTDALTGLPNRTVFAERFEATVAEACRSNRRAAVLFLDVDRFKTVNDSAGHGAGDELLAALGRRLTETVGERGAVIRFGGDEFVVILRDVREAAEVTALADEILADLRAPFTVGGREIIVTASIGIALHDQRPRTDAEEVLRNADVALYAAKEAGRAQYVVFEQGMALRSRQRLEVETALWTAVEERQFRVYYQPEVSLESGKIVGVEALARWHHPRLGPVSPADFIPIAEENGLITAIDDFVMEEACRQARTWRAAGPNGALVLSVNLSPREIKDPAVVQRVKDVLAATGLDPAGLRLEITENVLMEDTPAVMETLQALKALGVRIAIDDFGSGYSSLGYLHRFPTDALKVDRSFVDELGQNERSLPIIRAVIAASHTLGMRVTAEGVETAEQLARLREVGCDFGQGFLFARPLPSEDVTALLAADLPLVAPGPAFAA
ncbi:MAG TPA: GGDEF domain-containing protein, partial [Dehalococcoidia bacterium]